MTTNIELIRKKICIKIKLERTKRGWTQEKLAELSFLSKTYINAVEKGSSSPSADTLIKIANAFNMELADLISVDKVDL